MNWADDTLFGIRLAVLTSSAVLLLALATADAVLRWIVRRRLRRDRAAAAASEALPHPGATWFNRGLEAAVGPVALLMWTAGGAVALLALVQEPVFADVERPARLAITTARDAGLILALFWLLLRIGRVIELGLTSFVSRTQNTWDDAVMPVVGAAARVLLPIVALILAVHIVPMPDELRKMLRIGLILGLIGAASFLISRGIGAAETFVLQAYQTDVRDNLEARAVYTQVTVLRKVARAVLAIFTVAAMLMVFDSVRQLGTSILASAGVVGIVVGFAAQRSIATLLAGLQIAVTQPIRLDDVVIVENEWGRIEEITLTYVVVRIWDERRLIVPIGQFIERPFQNWTRTSATLLCTVFLYVDYTTPIDAVRTELTRILKASPRWDGRVNSVQVTDSRERTLEVRALASAADASTAWDLRCEVREKLVQFLRERHPDSLPRLRADLRPPESAAVGAM